MIWARWVSTLFHPLWVPTLGAALFLHQHAHLPLRYGQGDLTWRLLMLVFLFTAVLPVSGIFMFKRWGWVTQWSLAERSDRKAPLLFSSFSFLLLFYLLQNAGVHGVVLHIILGGVLSMTLSYFVNLFLKLSMHLMSWMSLAGQVAAFGFHGMQFPLFWLSVILLVAGIVASARLALGAHTPKELWVGSLVGFVSQAVWISLIQ